jgi:hypothetical protein
MADPKDNTSFFRKVVKFVANPTTEWAEIGAPADELRDNEFAKSELKAMIERKRRNDFVRKREFDMLRKVRREGLTSEQLAALGGSSKLDDSESNRVQAEAAMPEGGVKAKIDEIEQQMVGETLPGSLKNKVTRGPEFYNAPTEPMPMRNRATGNAPLASPAGSAAAPAPTAVRINAASPDMESPFAVEVSEVQHDPELDEAVIAFANADFEQCEGSLAALTGPGGARAQHAETWLVLFDLYRAIGQQHKFEGLALDYAQAFGWSAPQWFSMPRMVAEAAEASTERAPRSRVDGQVGWVCPEYLDAEGVAKLASQTLQMPLPWVFDWSALKGLDVEACARLSELFRSWMPQKLDLRWLGGERLFTVLADAAPTGVRDADPAYWQARLDALRMANRADQFDEAAIDYCVTYEVSPPSWEPAQCEVRVSGSHTSTTSPPLSMVSEVSTSFVESRMGDEAMSVQVSSVELSGQLVGDIGATLKKLEDELRQSTIVNVSCAKLIRVDFIAAGDLLNWVLARRGENRSVSFNDAHRLVALFFGAMGISEHAKVKVRTV